MSLQERFDQVADSEYESFDHISAAHRLHPNRALCGYLKVYSLLKPGKRKGFDLHGEHDIVYLAEEGDLVELTDDDIVYLTRCGIHFNSEFCCLADFC